MTDAGNAALTIHLEDELLSHPKILRAGLLLGDHGAARAFALYVAGIGYARQYLTNGFVPDGFVRSCGLVQTPQSVAKVLSSRAVRLWRKVEGGYEIHDYFHYNRNARDVRQIRQKWRDKKAAQRASKNGDLRSVSPGESPGESPGAPVRARVLPGTRYQVQERTSTDAARRLAFARHETQPPEPPSFALACVVMREALELSRRFDHDTTLANAGEHFKTLCARRWLAYDGALARKAYDALRVARAKRGRVA